MLWLIIKPIVSLFSKLKSDNSFYRSKGVQLQVLLQAMARGGCFWFGQLNRCLLTGWQMLPHLTAKRIFECT